MKKPIAFRVRLSGIPTVKFDGANAEQKAWEHALNMRKRGEVTIQHNAEGHWKRFALLCEWSVF